jgi:DNA-binding phage protein
MSSPLPYLVRMLLFLAAVAGLAYLLHHDLLRVFMNTPILNGVIVAVLVIGIFFVMRQVILLWPEVRWLRRFQHREEGSPPLEMESIDLLVPLASMLGQRQERFRLSPMATRALLDGIATRLDERRELMRYLIGLLIFLGLLGTFWGLLETIGAVADAIGGLQVSSGDAVQMFSTLKESIQGPLKGMATAFGASLFGLSGSLVLGFLELQASQAQGRFHTELEEWLAGATRISGGPQIEGEQGVSAYVEALLERTADGIDDLTRSLRRAEEARGTTVTANAMLVERLAALAETMRAQQNLLARMAEHSIELRGALTRLTERAPDQADRETLAAHQRNTEAYLARLLEENVRSRATLVEELRGVVGRLAERAPNEEREAMVAHQRNTEVYLARLVEENVRGRTALIEELRGTVERLGKRSSDDDSESVVQHQRAIEGYLARLLEDNAKSRTALADELRGEFRLLARTISSMRGANQPAGEG